MVRTFQSTPLPGFLEVSALSRRFAAAGGKRILITEETADVVARALAAYADLVHNRPDNDFDFYRIEAWDRGEKFAEVVGKVRNSSVARAAYEAAVQERPGSIVTLRKGAHLMHRHEPPAAS